MPSMMKSETQKCMSERPSDTWLARRSKSGQLSAVEGRARRFARAVASRCASVAAPGAASWTIEYPGTVSRHCIMPSGVTTDRQAEWWAQKAFRAACSLRTSTRPFRSHSSRFVG